MFLVPLAILPVLAEGGERIEARDAGKEGEDPCGLSCGAVADDVRAAGVLQVGKGLSLGAVAFSELPALALKIRSPDSLSLGEGLAALLRRRLCSCAAFGWCGFLAGGFLLPVLEEEGLPLFTGAGLRFGGGRELLDGMIGETRLEVF